MRKYYCTASDKKHLDSLTRDYEKDGWLIVTYGEYNRELKKNDELLVIVAEF